REAEASDAAAREFRDRAGRRSTDADEWTNRRAGLTEQAAAQRQEAERTLTARAEEAAREEAAHAGLAYERSLLHAREQAAKERRASHSALRDDLQGRELHLARLESDLDHLATTCREELALGLDELRAAPPAYEAGGALQDDEREVEGIKAALETIGPVNLMAIEQHTELEERFNFLLSQKKDLQDAIESLRDTIRKINRQSRDRFAAAFEAIQATFQQSFTTLFGGGHAELRLQEGEDDVLEAGIEIAAQPPGKRLQSIALLSGGEKALTAVALLFALFRYRPSPFCVLDEVDAPLDEANVERFTRLLQQLRDETQFILITHNRKSMEAADLLYGVTMEEPGVSKVLPLRFE
ncbi:MAG TPA: AAA family ATPase, partial [Candidatus Polarisedimenticolia bacterium]|nr:AAA family ATPase [Candidatus Polarisedimenticolia bacterium]